MSCQSGRAFPSASITGITDYWCPRWDTLKRDVTSDVLLTDINQVQEYYDVTGDGNRIEFRVNGGTARCIRVTSQHGHRLRMQFDDGHYYGGLTEDVHLRGQPNMCSGNMASMGADALTLRRALFKPTCRDDMQGSGIFMRDSFLDLRDASYELSLAHTDGVQTTGGCGPLFLVHNTILAEDGANYGGACANTSAGICTNATFFVQGRWSLPTACYRKVQSYVVADNFLSGGIYTNRWSNNNGPILNTQFVDNVFEDGRYRYGYCSHATSGYQQTTSPRPETTEFCFEYEHNETDLGVALQTVEADCLPSNAYSGRGSCTNIQPIPVTLVEVRSMSAESCTQGEAACDDIDITATVSTNEGARARATGATDPDTGTLLRSSSPGGSFRWRYSCGGSPANTSASPCDTAGRCSGYEDNGADLWYHYPDCNGQASCTFTDICDFQSESAARYMIKIYAEAGPGAAFRPSDHDAVPFTVN